MNEQEKKAMLDEIKAKMTGDRMQDIVVLEEEIRKLSDGKFTVDGSTSIEDVEELIGVELSDDDSETIAGFLLSNLGRIPAEGEQPSIEAHGLRFTASQTDGRRITEVLIEKL